MNRVLLFAMFACGQDHAAPPTIDAPVIARDASIDAPVTGCAQNADCVDGELCHWAPQHACGHDQGRGACAADDNQLCPDLAFWVCGCDGNSYFNECLSHAMLVDVDYGGPCRPAGAFVACTTSADCPIDPTFHQFCVDDPRDACDPTNGDTGCAGVCVHANQPCSDTSPCPPTGAISEVDSPDTEACVAIVGSGSDPGACAYTTRLHCTAAADCGAGELCLPDFNCSPGDPCLGWCVRP